MFGCNCVFMHRLLELGTARVSLRDTVFGCNCVFMHHLLELGTARVSLGIALVVRPGDRQ